MQTSTLNKTFSVWLFFILLILSTIACQQKPQDEATQKTVNNMDDGVVHPEWSKNAVIYEVNWRQYTPEGTAKAFESHLPRLKAMGVDILWFMPINPIGEKNRKGELGSYYSVKDYKDVNPELGTLADFQHLVEKIHTMGMYVIIDWVPNHTAWDNPLAVEHPEWYDKDSSGSFIPPLGFDWTDVIQLDYRQEGLRQYMINTLLYWVKDIGVDGFRFDVAWNIPVDFWNEVRKSFNTLEQPVFMLAEAEIAEQNKKAMNMSYGWDFHHIMNAIAKGEKEIEEDGKKKKVPANVYDIDKYLIGNYLKFPPESYLMMFTSNHDENSWNGTVYERMPDSYKTFATLTFIFPDMPLIYSGQEAGLDRRLKFFEKDLIDWKDSELTAFYTQLIQLKKNNRALWNGNFGGKLVRVSTSDDSSVFACLREKEDNKVLAVFNLTAEPVEITFKKNQRFVGSYQEALSGESLTVEADTKLGLDSWGYRVLVAM